MEDETTFLPESILRMQEKKKKKKEEKRDLVKKSSVAPNILKCRVKQVPCKP